MRTATFTCLALIIVATLAGGLTWGQPDEARTVKLYPYFAEGKWGYKDDRGKVIFEPTFRRANSFSQGVAFAQDEKELYVITIAGNKFDRRRVSGFSSADSFAEGLVAVRDRENKWGYVDRELDSSRLIIDFQFDEADRFSQGLAAVKRKDKWGFIDAKGDLRTELAFEAAASFAGGLAAVRQENVWGYIDTYGTVKIRPQYDLAGPFAEGFAPIQKGKKWGYIDKYGKDTIEPVFEAAGCFSEGLACVRKGGRWGYIDKSFGKTQKLAIDYQFDLAGQFENGRATVLAGKIWSVIDMRGTQVEKVKIGPGDVLEVMLDSEPVGAVVYLVPKDDWFEGIWEKPAVLKEFRVTESKTLVDPKPKRPQQRYRALFELGKKRDEMWLDVMPGLPNAAKGYPQ
jgi:hypothetical protein